jgi:hypothetical protein
LWHTALPEPEDLVTDVWMQSDVPWHGTATAESLFVLTEDSMKNVFVGAGMQGTQQSTVVWPLIGTSAR